MDASDLRIILQNKEASLVQKTFAYSLAHIRMPYPDFLIHFLAELMLAWFI